MKTLMNRILPALLVPVVLALAASAPRAGETRAAPSGKAQGRPGAKPQTQPAGAQTQPAATQSRPAAQPHPAAEDAKAAAIADEVLKAGGGPEALAATRYFRYTFTVVRDDKEIASRTHWWDRSGDRHRIEMIDKDGKNVVCLTYLPTREGACTVGDKAVFDADAKPYVDSAYEAWINDTYWLMMPYKMKDPGVHLKYDGQETIAGQAYDKVLVTFDAVGLTPKDRYWAFVNRKTKRMDRWAFVLQDDKGSPGTGEPRVFDWRNWARYGKIWLSSERVAKDGKTKILFKDLAVFETLPEGVFLRTEKVDLSAPKPSSGPR